MGSREDVGFERRPSFKHMMYYITIVAVLFVNAYPVTSYEHELNGKFPTTNLVFQCIEMKETKSKVLTTQCENKMYLSFIR